MTKRDVIAGEQKKPLRPGVPGVILAGGAGRRIGGGKAFQTLVGKPLWRHVADRIAPQVTALAINGAGQFDAYPTLPDEVADLGPLGGVLSAMVWAKAFGELRVLTVAVDTPFLPLDLVVHLSQAEAPVAMAETADGLHGTTALWHTDLQEDLRHALSQGARKVTHWATDVGLSRMRFPDGTPPPFFNVNTPQDLAQAEMWLT